jgi:hypothetical protein
MVGWMLVMVFGAASAATYEETFTPKAGKAYNEDINVWVYTSEFAQRFGMPKEWVDDELKGAYAVAYRVVTTPFRTCFLSGDPNKCMTNRECMLDVYIPDDAKIPWADDRPMARLHDYDSARYVLPQTPEDRTWWLRPIGIESPGKKARRPLIYFGQVRNDKRGSLLIREYDKTIYPGVSYISFSRGCWEMGRVAYQIDFLKDSAALSDDYAKSDIAHRIEVPEQYMKRVHQNWYEREGKGAAKRWREVIGK